MFLKLLLLGYALGFDPSSYTDSQVMWSDSGEDIYTVYWSVGMKTIDLALKVKTTGWVGFGIAEQTSGTMGGSDILQGYVKNGIPSIKDRHVLRQYPSTNTFPAPSDDCSQDWILIGGEEADEFTILEVSRQVDTDDAQDRPILLDQDFKIIMAYGSDNQDEFNLYHTPSRRKASVIRFLGQASVNPVPTFLAKFPTITSHDFLINWRITNVQDELDQQIKDLNENGNGNGMFYDSYIYDDETNYVGAYMFLPDMVMNGDQHLVAVETLIQESTAKNVHHFTLTGYYFDSNFKPIRQNEMLYAWAPGVGPMTTGECGFRISIEDRGYNALYLQTHYDNPERLENLKDNSGIRLYFTNSSVSADCGVTQFGRLGIFNPTVPKGISQYDYVLDSEGIEWGAYSEVTFFSSVLHMHVTGREIWLEKWTKTGNGSYVIENVLRIDFWDFNFQSNQIPRIGEFKFKKGDKLKLSCIYETKDNTTKWGAASLDEMCIAFNFYYPLVPGLQFVAADYDPSIETITMRQNFETDFGKCTKEPPSPVSSISSTISSSTSVSSPTTDSDLGGSLSSFHTNIQLLQKLSAMLIFFVAVL